MGFPRQEYWSGLPFPSPGDLPYPGIEPTSPALASRFFTTEPPGKSLGWSLLGTNSTGASQNHLPSTVTVITVFMCSLWLFKVIFVKNSENKINHPQWRKLFVLLFLLFFFFKFLRTYRGIEMKHLGKNAIAKSKVFLGGYFLLILRAIYFLVSGHVYYRGLKSRHHIFPTLFA